MTNTTLATVKEFLAKHPTGVLSTASTDGNPWGSTVVFAIDDDLTFYFMSRANTRKYQNIAANPNVALTVTDEAQQITVQVTGVAKPVEMEDMMDVVFQKLDKVKPKGSEHWIAPVYKIHEGDYMILEFKPTSLHYADFSAAPEDANSNFIEQII